MYVNLYGNSTAFQTLALLQGETIFITYVTGVDKHLIDLKLGQYVKLPPRVTFSMQLSGSILGAIFNYTSEYTSAH